MSKIIEALKSKAPDGRNFTLPQKSETGHVDYEKSTREITQEQLAEIYFSAKGKNSESGSNAPVIIKVVEKTRIAAILPWIITSLAFLITAFSLFSTKRIFVDIRVVDENSELAMPAREIFVPPSADLSERSHDSKSLLGRGERIPFLDFVFEGAAYLKSSRDKNLLTLVNSSVAPFARATVNFSHPMNLRGGKIVFYAKGAYGGEGLAVALKDTGNIQAFLRGKVFPFPRGLTSSWQRAEIELTDVSKNFDSKHVDSFRFEFGAKDTGNRPGDTVFIKDLTWHSE